MCPHSARIEQLSTSQMVVGSDVAVEWRVPDKGEVAHYCACQESRYVD